MSVLYSDSNITLNQTGSTISFSKTTVGLSNISLISNSSSNWAQTANHSLYNVVYVEGRNNKGLNFGPSEPLIIVIEKATDSSNNLLKVHEFELSFDRLSAKQIDATVSTTPVGLAALEQYYDADLNKNSIISNYGTVPKNFELEELSTGYVFDFAYLETISQTGLTHLLTPLKVSAGASWGLNTASETVFYSLAQSIPGSSASASTLELKVLTDAPSASVTGGFSASDGFSVNSFILDSVGSQFTLYNSASATSSDFSVFEYTVGHDLNTDNVIGHAIQDSTGTAIIASTYSPSYQLNNKSAGSSFLFGSAFSSNHTIFQTSGEIVSFNGNFYQHDYLTLGNDGAGIFGYSHFSTEDQKTGSLPIKPDVIFMDGSNPWQPVSFVSPSSVQQLSNSLPTAHGVLAISAAAGAGGITFVTDFHNDVYVFQASTSTNTSTTLSIFESPYYFEFDPSASQISSLATAAPIFHLSQSISMSGDLLAVVEKNIGENVNNDSVTGAISATQVLASTAYTTNITTSSGQVSLSVNSPALFSGQGGFLIWNQSSGVTNNVSDTANDNEYFIIAEPDLTTWSASGTLVLTGGYSDIFNLIGENAQVSAETQSLVRNEDGAVNFSLVFDTQTSNSFGSVYSVYTFATHTALDSVAVWNSSVSSFAVRDLESFETTLGYDITGDGIVGNSGLTVQSIVASKTGLATANSAQSTNLLKLESGEFAIGNETPQVGQPTTGKLLINSSATSWSPSSGASAVGVYRNVLESNSATESYVVVQKSGTDNSPQFGLWSFSSDTSLLSLQTNQSTATHIDLIDLVSHEMQLGFDITGDNRVGDQISEISLNYRTSLVDTNDDGVLDSTKVIPAVIKSSLGFFGVDYDTANIAVSNSHPFIILKDSSGSAWSTSLNYELSGIYQSEVINNQSTIGIIERSGSTLNPFYQKWNFAHQSGSYTAQVSASTATRLTTSELIAEEQTYSVDLDGNGTVGDDIDRYLFLDRNNPALVQTQIGNYAISFDEVLGVNDLGLPILITTSNNPWTPTRGNFITGVFTERSGSAQTISIIENAGSNFSPAYKKWEFSLSDGSFFATAQTTLSVSISSAKLGAQETRKNIDLLADGVIGDPIKSVIVSGGETSFDSDNDGFADGTVTAPSIILTKSNSYALDLSGAGNVGETSTSLFLEASTGANWNPSTNYTIVGGYVSYDVNASSEQTISAFVYEKSGSGSSAIYKEWHFVQGSASGVATATSGIAQTISLTDILAKELERGFDLTNDNVVGDRIVDLTKQLPVPQRGAPSVVELASGSYVIDFEGNSTVGQLKSVINLKTSSGQNWSPSQGSEVIGVYSSEELESSGQIKYYATLFEQTGTGSTPSFKKWIFSKPSGQADFQASASTSTVVTLTDILIDEGRVGFDLNSDGTVGDVIADITWQVPPVDTGVTLNAPQVVQLASGAYGLDIEGDLPIGSTTPVVVLSNSTGSNWQPTSGSTVTGVYLGMGGTTASPTNLSTIVEKSGSSNFPTFKTWTFSDSGDGAKAVATVTVGQSITESALLQKELEVGYDLNGDETVGDGIFSIALLSKDYLGTDQQVLNSPGVVRLSSGEFGLVFGGNDYSTENGRSFLLKEIESIGNAWTPFSNPSADGRDYSISGAELLENSDLKIYEVKESAEGDPDVKVTTFTPSVSSPESYFVKSNQSDGVAISDSDFFNRELEIGYNLDSNQVLGPGAEEITVSPQSFTDKFGVNQKSPSLAKLADGSVAVDFIGNIQLGETPKLILNQGAQPFRYSLDEQVQGLYTSTETNDSTNQVTFNVNVLQRASNTNSDFFLRSFNVVDDSSANYDNTKALQPVTPTEVLSKEEMVRYDLNNNGQVGFQNRELLMPAFSTSPGPDDFRLVRTETNAIGLDSAFTLTLENDQYFYSLYDSNGSLWELDNETVTGMFLEDRIENTEGEDTTAQLRTQSSADTILGVATNPAGGSVTSTSIFNLREFVISGDATPNALGLYEFHMVSANAARYSLDELSIVESEKGFDLTGDRKVLGDTAVELFRKQIVESDSAREMVSGELTGLPDIPAVSEITSELLMPGVSLQTENISYGNLTSGLKKATVNSFVSNGNITLNFSDNSTETTSAQSQTNVLIDAQVELSYYSLGEPLSEESDLVHFVALGSKERAANSFQAIGEFTDVLHEQGSKDELGAPVVASKMKLFDFSENNPIEVDSDEIILQLAESEGVVLLAPDQTSGVSTFVNINNEPAVSASEILLIGEFSVRGGEGKQTFVGDDSKQDLSLGSGDDIVFAGGGDDILIASDGNNYFDGGAGNDEIAAGSGMDVFVGGAGDDVIDGGDGLDKAEYVGSYYDFTIEKQLDSFSVNDRLSLEGTDTLTNVERLEFADGTLAFDTNGNAGQAYRLYQAAFERTPDPVGVGYHVNDIESNGLILYQIAGNFLASPEFESTYGSNLNDSDFVDALYDNVLGRSPDEFERDYYTDRFSRAENDPLWMDRAASLIGFSESPENMNIVNDDILNGIWMTNDYM
ncbi:MAG: DUF4214 domain-containing protein [Burkholderiaceae bacterium]|nr:MAG: DUF4214 domain-containing protein [Burkholderiaceae bacterium]